MKKYKTGLARPRKREIQSIVNGLIYNTLPAPVRARGISIMTLLGPEMMEAIKPYKSLLGTQGRIVSAEWKSKTFIKQHYQHRALPPKQRNRIHPEAGKFLTVLNQKLVSNRFRGHYLLLDYDAMCTLATMVKTDLKDFEQAAKLLAKHGYKKVWLVITHSTDRSGGKAANKRNLAKIKKCIESTKKWTISNMHTMSYKDEYAMYTTFMELDRG